MIRGTGTITYLDERTAHFSVLPIDLSRAERWLALHGLPIDVDAPGKVASTHALLLAHSALQRQGELNGTGFEPWADTVFDIDLVLDSVPPTPPDTSDE